MALSSRGRTAGTTAPLTLPAIAGRTTPRCRSTASPASGLGTEAAYEVISAELLLDGQARLNLATFVTTWMPALGGAS